ncbi:acid protease [Tilletiaria anomala UBC 951]|uniref:Acid protease n=1 Tax=Tilletiaria anomala (strain ATCC 24038 / CBS 436.72 / UBC 951) TaxID=1037660 RepID=A0A066WH17_TILAU|nr:acid protease [Tilletiaria anomala UBC 951]KDN53287.1 acid protease [Tilletiaria anomala UBC 951]
MSPTRLSADNTLDEPQKRLLSQMQTANEEVVREGPVRLSKRKLLFKHGRVGIVMKDPSTNAATASMAKRLFGGLLDGLLSGGSSSGAGQPSQTALPPLQPSSAVMPMADNSTVIGQPQNKQAPASYASGGYPKADLAAAISGGLQSASPPVSQGSLGLNIEANDVGYVATIRIGSAQTPFRMLIDSGSADTWVASTACQQCGNDHQKLGTEVSTSFQHLAGSSFSITYGTGAVRGALGSDNINVAGMTLQNHTLGLATQETTDFSDPSVPFDGLMGLAKTELSNSNTPTPIDALYQAGLVTAPVMGYHLGRVADGTNSGEVTFGAVDAQKYQGTLLEIPNVSTKGFWEAAVTGVSYAGRDLGLTGRTAILDTGTSLIVAPQADADAVHAAIPGSHADGQGGYTIPCTTTGVFAFKFQGQTFGIDPRDMTFLPVDQNNRKGDCVSAISAGIVGDPNEWLVGAAFLKNVYFATNARDNMIGIARLAP